MEAARSMRRRIGVSLTPMVALLVSNAPNQWLKLITSGPLIPGKKYCLRRKTRLRGERRSADHEQVVTEIIWRS
jgi:hypothetical protein